VARASGTLNGVAIEPGYRIFIARSGADRGLATDIKLDRTPNRHTAFGLGVHRCVGSHVARIEMRISLEVWHERFTDYSLPADFIRQDRYGSFMQQIRHLPLEIPDLVNR
jgi:cytochrome P450